MPFVACDQNKEPVEVSVCLRNHQDACQEYIMRQRSKAPEKFNPCRCCPTALELKERKEPEPVPIPVSTQVKKGGASHAYVKGKCQKCGEEKNLFKKLGICPACKHYGQPVVKEVATEPAPKPGQFITLDFTKYPWIKEGLEKSAEAEMRTVQAHAMWVLQYHLTDKRP